MNCGKTFFIYQLMQQQPFIKKPNKTLATHLLLGIMIVLAQCTVEGPQKKIILNPGEILPSPGDTVYSLANKHRISVRKFIEANGLIPPYTLKEDQKLVVPTECFVPEPANGPCLISPEKDVEWSNINEPIVNEAPQTMPDQAADPRLMEEIKKSKSCPVSAVSTEKPLPAKKSLPITFSTPVNGDVAKAFNSNGPQKCHGIYFSANAKTPVKASALGKVICVGEELEKGNPIVVIEHKDGWLTAYGPLDNIKVKEGQEIAAQAVLGEARGPEVYFEMRHNRKLVDPKCYLKK